MGFKGGEERVVSKEGGLVKGVRGLGEGFPPDLLVRSIF